MLYVGTYASEKSPGIYLFRLDPATGALTPAGSVSGITNPSFLTLHLRRFLYAVSETGGGQVVAFSLDAKTGLPTLLNQQSSRGGGPCYLAIDKGGKNVLVANYGGGSVAALPIAPDGRLLPATAFMQHVGGSGANPRRQKAPFAHSINPDAAERFVVAADLGADKLFVYRFDAAKGTLAPNDPPFVSAKPGAGPRHFAFHPNGRAGYVINEIDSTITAYHYDAARGTLAPQQTVSTLPPGATPGDNSTAEIQVHPNGRFLYGSNRGHDSIVVFAINAASGRLSLVEHESTQGKTPRHFGISPAGDFLIAANQGSDTLVVFRIDAQTGRLSATGHTASVPKPVCVKFS